MDQNDDAETGCVIVGGGPAGVLLSLLLARKGVAVTLLEMHRDFDRDFRGDTVHASTLEVLDQIGLAEPLHELPHARIRRMRMVTTSRTIDFVDLSRLKTKFPYIMMMPQFDFLEFLSSQAEQYPSYKRIMGAGVFDLIQSDDVVTGVRYKHDGEEHEIKAALTVACDGRFSRMRKLAKVEAKDLTAPMDAAWFRVTRKPDEDNESGMFYLGGGNLLVMLMRPTEWQIAFVFPKGDFQVLRNQGIERFRESIANIVPWLGDRVHEIESFHDVHLLKVGSDRLPRWHLPGLLFLGDAAHVMSPVGGIGINYAVGDAVEAANVLTTPLLKNAVVEADLAEVQNRRERVTRMAQRMQGVMQDNFVARALRGREFDLPLLMRIALKIPGLRDIPARLIALGFRRLRLENP